MRTVLKYAGAAALTAALALAAATPSEARHGRNAALIGGFAAGAIVGAAAANSGYYYGGPAYYYGGPAYYEPYAYEPAPVYVAPAPAYVAPRPVYRGGGCWHSTDKDRGYGYYGAC